MPVAIIASDPGPQDGSQSAARHLAQARAAFEVAGGRMMVFRILRDLALIPVWWPPARSVIALPVGRSGKHARALVDCGGHALELRVIDYRPCSRLLFALHGRGAPLLVGIDIQPSGGGSKVVLTVSAAGRGGTVKRAFERLRVERLAWRSGRRLRRLLSQTASDHDRREAE